MSAYKNFAFVKKFRNIAAIICLIGVDISAFYASLFFAYYSRKLLAVIFPEVPPLRFSLFYFIGLWWMVVVFIFFIAYEKLYTKRVPFWDEIKNSISAITIAVVVILAVVTLGKMGDKISRLTVLFLWLYGLAFFPFFRLIGKRFLYRASLWKENLIVLGAGRAGIEAVKGIMNEKHLGYEVVGFLDDDPDKLRRVIEINEKEFRVFGKLKNFSKFVNLLNIETVLIAIPSFSPEKLSNLTNNVQRYTKKILLVPDVRGIALLNTELHHLFMQQLFLLKINNNLQSIYRRALKRIFDVIASIFLLPFVLPAIGVMGLLIKKDSPGPVFFVQDRLGRNKNIFKCLKFRTMYVDSDSILKDHLDANSETLEEWNKYKKLKTRDPRVTGIGRFLRKTSLDELPQIFNVLKGEMSLVGPRPYLPRELNDIGDYSDTILLPPPGMTGLWQISGRNELYFEDRVKLDVWYVMNWSLWLDIVILFKTVKVVFKMEGVY